MMLYVEVATLVSFFFSFLFKYGIRPLEVKVPWFHIVCDTLIMCLCCVFLQSSGTVGCVMLGPSCTYATFQLVE